MQNIKNQNLNIDDNGFEPDLVLVNIDPVTGIHEYDFA